MVDSKHQWKAWLYLSPAIILLLIFTVWPIINTLIMAFSDGYSSMKNQRTLKENSQVTVYGTLEKNGRGQATFASGAKFLFGQGIDDNDDVLVKEIFLTKPNMEGTVALIGEVSGTPQYNSDTESWSFNLLVESSDGESYTAVCNNATELNYEFDLEAGDKNTIYITGKISNKYVQKLDENGNAVLDESNNPVKVEKTITENGKNYTLYTLENGTYVSDLNTSNSKRNEFSDSSKKDQQAAVINGLAQDATANEMTLAVSVYSIEAIHDDDHVTIVCHFKDGKGNNMFIECDRLQASERTGLKLGSFFLGISNFKQVINYAEFGQCLLNTMLLTVLTVPLSTLLALLIAVCLNAIKPLQRLLQTIFFLPYVTNSIAIGMVFATMFNMVGKTATGDVTGTIGVVNSVIEFFGGTRINWMNDGSTYAANIAVMTIYIVWNALPFKILILLGGLQSVNKQYYDAAKVDGTSRSRTFWRITVPLLSPMIAYVVITGFIGGFKEYSSIVGVFGDKMGPVGDAGRLNTMVGFIYDAIANDVQGKASAAALILFGIILVVTLINLSVSNKKVHY